MLPRSTPVHGGQTHQSPSDASIWVNSNVILARKAVRATPLTRVAIDVDS